MPKRWPLLLLIVVLLPSFAVSQNVDCSMYVYAPPQMPRQNKCVYSTHVSVGTAVVKTPKMSANMNVAFYSKFFDGLERVTAANGFEFRKTGHAVTNYPAALTVLITPPRSFL
jgi:hypothetical protein